MTLREQICNMIDVLDEKGLGGLVTDSAPCWVRHDQYGATQQVLFYLSDGTSEMWLIADTHTDRVHRLDRKEAEILMKDQEQNRFNFGKFRQSRERAA